MNKIIRDLIESDPLYTHPALPADLAKELAEKEYNTKTPVTKRPHRGKSHGGLKKAVKKAGGRYVDKF